MPAILALAPLIAGLGSAAATVGTVGTVAAAVAVAGAVAGATALASDDDVDFQRKVQRGDVIGVARTGYEHYGVYVSNSEVIHYTSPNSDVGDNKIMATPFDRFIRDASDFFILNFPDEAGKATKSVGIPVASVLGAPSFPYGRDGSWILDLLRKINYTRYSADEIVSRARSKLGEDSYSLLFNNCEHFAIWCATNVKESQQIQKLLEVSGRGIVINM